MTDTDTTADRLRELSGTVLNIGHGLHGLARDTDYLVRRAESAEARVEELEAERGQWEHGAGIDLEERDDLRAEVEQLHSAADAACRWLQFSNRIEALGEDPEAWAEEAPRLVQAGLRVDQIVPLAQRFAREGDSPVPRVIRPDEWKAGQTVAVRREWNLPDSAMRWCLTKVFQPKGGGPLRFNDGALSVPQDDCDDYTVVLLADAPEDAPADGGAVVDAHVIGEDVSNANHMHLDLAPTTGSVADILQSINDSIARALTPRRGEVINPDDLHTGDVIDVWAPGGKRDVKGHVVRSLGLWRDVGQLPGNEIRLVRRPSCVCGCGATP